MCKGDNGAMLKLEDLFDVGDIVRALRLKKGIKGEEAVRKQLGIDKDTLSRLERTSRYDPQTLDRIAEAMDTTAAAILEARDYLRGRIPRAEKAAPICADEDHMALFYLLDRMMHGQVSVELSGIIGREVFNSFAKIAASLNNRPPEGKQGPGTQEMILASGKRIRRGRRR